MDATVPSLSPFPLFFPSQSLSPPITQTGAKIPCSNSTSIVLPTPLPHPSHLVDTTAPYFNPPSLPIPSPIALPIHSLRRIQSPWFSQPSTPPPHPTLSLFTHMDGYNSLMFRSTFLSFSISIPVSTKSDSWNCQ